MKTKIRECLLAILLFIQPTCIAIHALETSDCIDVRNFDVTWENGLNNNIRVIDFDGEIKYFKECKRKLNLKGEVQRIINDYFDEYLPDKTLPDKQILTETLLDENNFGQFVSAGFLWNRDSNLSKYIRGETTADSLGIPEPVAKNLNIDLKDFFLYSSRELIHRHISANIAEGELQTTLAVKQLATYRLAKLFGVDDLVVKTEFVKLITDYGEKFGVLTAKARGTDIKSINEENLVVDPQFQKDLTSLQILDTITNEQDHNPGNCFFKIENNRLVGVTAFDNEGCFWLGTNLHRGLCWNVTSALLTEENKINLPHISKSLGEKILAIKNEDIINELKDLLSEDQIESCIKRFSSLKEALANTVSDDENFLLDDNEWSDETISQEVSGAYGNTYFVHFLKKIHITIK